MRYIKYNGLVKTLTCLGCIMAIYCADVTVPVSAADRRAYQHGIDFLSLGAGEYWLVWSSSAGNPPQGKKTAIQPDGSQCSYFTHDIFYSRIEAARPDIDTKLLVSLPEAQEPVSAAISAAGTILVTFEDGSDSDLTNCQGVIQQRFKLFDRALSAKTPLQTVAIGGGHSGHVAAVAERFAIAYSEGWVDGGGDENSGTGKTVYLDVVSENGELLHHRAISKDKRSRDWWPLVAGSPRHVMLTWQTYVKDTLHTTLMYCIYDPVTYRFIKPATALQTDVHMYHYDVQYLSAVNRFLVAGNDLDDTVRESAHGPAPLNTQKGFVYLLDEQGNIVNRWSSGDPCKSCDNYHSRPFVREAQPAIFNNGQEALVLYPVTPKGLILFSVNSDSITLKKYVNDDYYWRAQGTDGVFFDQKTAYFANLSPLGLQARTIHID